MTDPPELGLDATDPAPPSAADAATGAPKRPAARRPATPRATTPRKRPAPTAKAPEEGAPERPKRTRRPTAAQSSPDTVRAPRGKARAEAPATTAAPDEDHTTTKLLPPAVVQPDDEHTTTKLLPPARPEQGDEETEVLAPARPMDDETTELVPPAGAPGPAEDRTTELVAPARAPRPTDDETTEFVAPAGHARSGDETTELLHTGPQVQVAPAVARPRPEAEPDAPPHARETVLQVRRLSKRFGTTLAVDGIDLDVQAGSFAGIVGPNGAGKTTTLSMVTGLLRPDAGTVQVHGIDVWRDPERAKRTIGVLPDALRLFDRLTGAQLLHYSGVLRGLDAATVKARSADLVQAFGLEDATGRIVADYSAGMTKKIALAAAMIHSPRLLVLDEPFESVDPVSAANIIEILQNYVGSGGTVVLSSHGMDLIQRVCDHVAIVVGGRILASGTTDEVRAGRSLEDRFVELAGGRKAAKGMEWLHSFTD